MWLWLATAGAFEHTHEVRLRPGACISTGTACVACEWLALARTTAVVLPDAIFDTPSVDLTVVPAEIHLQSAALFAASSRAPPTA
jgi:hypothetical protein